MMETNDGSHSHPMESFRDLANNSESLDCETDLCFSTLTLFIKRKTTTTTKWSH